MRSKLFLFVYLVCFCIKFALADRRAVLQRQDRPTNLPPTDLTVTIPSSSKVAQTQGGSGTNEEGGAAAGRSSSTFATRIHTTDSSSDAAKSTPIAGSEAISNINGAAATSTVNLSTYNATLTPNKLPLTPVVTPAYGIGGVILVLSGLPYTLVGIKNKILHISLSAAYLASLSVTVLILYVMSLSVSDAIQGAYLVAVVMTGVVLGGVSVMFAEMTEGLGCLLGGFCFSMWLLVLKPGGLLTETSSKSIFIAVFTLTAFAAVFSHYTRDCGLILGISFAGATAVVLGIDCFSRAGLKEFWAYLWNLNPSLFPVGATSYPIGRGLKVEIAAIMVLFLAGVVSQMRLWEVIREHRERRILDRLNDEQNKGQEEKRVSTAAVYATAGNGDQWEAVYGNKEASRLTRPTRSNPDSGVGDMKSKKEARSDVTSLRRSDDEIKMTEVPSPTFQSSAGLITPNKVITVRVACDFEPAQVMHGDGTPVKMDDESRFLLRDKFASSQKEDKTRVVIADSEAVLGRRTSQREPKRVSAGPDVVPLPFRVPDNDAASDRSSVATFADDDEATAKRRSKNLSVGSILMQKLTRGSVQSLRSSRNSMDGAAVSTDNLLVSREVEDDRASSIAATVDGLSDDEDMRSSRSSLDNPPNTTDTARLDQASTPDLAAAIEPSKGTEEPDSAKSGEVTRPISTATTGTETLDPSKEKEDIVAPATPRSLTSSTDPKLETASSKDESSEVGRDLVEPSAIPAADSKMASITKERLPPQVSKVVMSYRTNEWAKHLSGADAPELGELKLAEYPADNDTGAETAVPVNVEELQQTAEISLSRPVSRTASQTLGHGQTLTRQNSSTSKMMPGGPSRTDTSSTYQPHDNGLVSSASRLSMNSNVAPRGSRSSTGLLNSQQIAESQIAENFPSSAPKSSKPPSAHAAFGESTLLGKRESMLRSRPSYSSTHSNAPTPLAPQPLSSHPGGSSNSSNNDAGSINSSPYTPPAIYDDDDNMTLSTRRRELLRRSSLIQQLNSPNPSISQQSLVYDSHQPQRQLSAVAADTAARAHQLALWRASVQQDLQASVQPRATLERSRSTLWRERQAEELKRAELEKKRERRDSIFDERMRRGDMLDAHREALRKMQASANKHI
ncbi:uncharacterized protein L3040_002304 [Drepanopeziza brunnea f. sp. 'multigermtubi']|uniref:TM7S3/TM198-like domain-containing protein n=1 Tax=Marssonina brunnea f. sp. multigermtubi (strain MB_m1) TaxID=1072389 RepID=K1Y4A7_MARBU|nr:uncharacterized protein MBM_01971 [Drepanopeziza brunnea f. sp. 'multigermtubi' MB_m1]EKD20019.1 hypothetical protein MBM_01971 [Drepanopeziza brunnea f. sp. 'multigermtubi' MB_m1]KAJ5050421.1 hypothetical protein L3040_002304 [Drepanopeziza brunnea f. sp. 'multigermtubi']